MCDNLLNEHILQIKKYQGVKEFHMLARIGCYCNIMVFIPFKVKVTYYHPLNLWLLGATNGNQGQTVMHFNVLRLSATYNGYKISKYASNFKFPTITN